MVPASPAASLPPPSMADGRAPAVVLDKPQIVSNPLALASASAEEERGPRRITCWKHFQELAKAALVECVSKPEGFAVTAQSEDGEAGEAHVSSSKHLAMLVLRNIYG